MAAEPRSFRWTRNCTRRAPSRVSFSLLEQARRFATRYDKTLRNYVAVVASGVRWFGCVSDLILAALGQLDQH